MTADDDALVDALLAASRSLMGIAIRSVQAAPVDVTVPQHRVLVLLDDNGALGIGDIAAELGVNPSNATRVCDRLERLGLVERSRSRHDGRAVLVALTAGGREVLDAVTRTRREEIVRVVAHLDGLDSAAVVQAVEAVTAAAREVAAVNRARAARGALRDPGRARSASS